MTGQLEFQILYLFQEMHRPWLDQLMIFFTFLGENGWLWIATGILLLAFKKTRFTGASVLTALFFSLIFCNLLLKNWVARPRPCWLEPGLPLLIPVPTDYSFPSGHAMASFAAAATIVLNNRRIGILALALAALIACSRLYLFVHFPTDVAAGMILGCLDAWIVNRMLQWYVRQRTKTQDRG